MIEVLIGVSLFVGIVAVKVALLYWLSK